jgi:acyl-CoA synthetase (NDP forming)
MNSTERCDMLNEIDSKALLKRYGVATTEPFLAASAAAASAHAGRLGRPVAMKIVSAEIVHKAAAGGVSLDVAPGDVPATFERLMRAVAASQPDATLEGILVEEMVPAGLEIFIGARLDPQFGMVVLLGRGGTGVEQSVPPAAVLGPLDDALAERLIMRAFGDGKEDGIGAAARAHLRRCLTAVAGAGGLMQREGIGEIDINPIILGADRAIAVDGVLIPQAGAGAVSDTQSVDAALAVRRSRLQGLGALFDPQAIAFVGASTSRSKLGYRVIRNLLDFGFRGPIYPIHPSAGEICGLTCYPTIEDVPGPVDRAFVAVAAAQVPDVLAACARKGVAVAQVLTAGFSEWSQDGDESGHDLEKKIAAALSQTPMRMVGPNCIGTFSASSRIAMGAPRFAPSEPGGITFISQSGTFAGDVVRRAQVQGIPVGRTLSCGNCGDLDLIDYMLFCEDDPNTRLIAFYAESIRDAGLFFRLAERVSKPIVMLKGGITEQGSVAASSHTAALATNAAIWNAAVAQAGILQVHGIDDLMDAMLIFGAHGALRGNRLGIFGSGGGVSVTSADAAALSGMVVPRLSPQTAEALKRFGVPGTSVANPIDIPVWGLKDGSRWILEEIADLLKRDPVIDSIIAYIEMGSIMDFADSEEEGHAQLVEICQSIRRASQKGPKISLVLRSSGDKLQDEVERDQRLALLSEGIAVFSSTARAVRAHAKLFQMTRPAPTQGSQS